MKRKLSLVFGLVIVVFFLFSAVSCGQPSDTSSPGSTLTPATSAVGSGPTIQLKFAAYHAATTSEAQICQEFADEIKSRTNGRVQIQFYPGGSLIDAAGMYDGITNGIADIGNGNMSYTIGKFPETELALCPLGVRSPWAMTHALNEFFFKYNPKEYNATHMLFMWGNGPAGLYTTKAVRSLEDIKGLKIRAHGQDGQVAKALGAAAQSLPMSEMYDALSKGVVDGVLVDASVLISWRLGDVIKYITDCSPAVGNAFLFYVTMNNDTWNKLPPDVQAIVKEVSDEFIEKAAVAINQQNIDGLQYALNAGAELIELSDSEIARWKALADPITQTYLNSLPAKGLNAEDQKEHLQFLLDRVSYWGDEQSKKGIPFPFSNNGK